MTPTNDPVVLDIEQIPGATIETVVPNADGAEDEVAINPALAPVPNEPPAPPAPELRYEYQPTDADGRPLGGKQVILYRTPEELAYKLSDQSTQLLRKLREVTRKNALGISDDAPQESNRYTGPQELKPRTLTPEERAQLAQDILDPERFDQAVTTVFEASIGTSAKGLSEKITRLEQENQKINAIRESDLFMAANPDYVKCAENGEVLSTWVARKGYAPTAENFQKAYDTLLQQGVLVTSLEVVPQKPYEHVDPVAPVVPSAPAREEIPVDPPKPVVSRVGSGLSRNNSSDAGVPAPIGDDIVYEFIQKDNEGRQVGERRTFKGRAAIEAMPPDEYKRRLLHEKGFGAKVEKLYARK